MYEAREGLVNGDIVNDLFSLCNNWFVDPWVQPYTGANFECMFCGCTRTEQGKSHHSAADCPIIHLQDIANKYLSRVKEK